MCCGGNHPLDAFTRTAERGMRMYKCCECGKPTENIKRLTLPSGTEFSFSRCDECKDRLDREYDYQAETETIKETELICPHCQASYDWYDAYEFEEGTTEEVECMFCGKKFDLEVEHIYRFSTKRSICEMPSDYGKEE